MNNLKTTYFSLDNFIKTGEIFSIKKGEKIFNLPKDLFLQTSQMMNEKGEVNLYDFMKEGVRFRLGVEEKTVSYIMIAFNRYNMGVKFTIGDIDIQNQNLSWLLEYLNSQKIDWRYKEVMGKILVVSINQDTTEFVYSYEKEEEGFYCFQTYIPPIGASG